MIMVMARRLAILEDVIESSDQYINTRFEVAVNMHEWEGDE